VTVDFGRLTDAHLRAAEVVSAVDARRAGAELPLYATAAARSRWVLKVLVSPDYRDEQVAHIRRRLAALRRLDTRRTPGATDHGVRSVGLI
jgi:hypothetical protein